ncbi:hypothetical protein DFJ73DRAFT_656967 [Zopfochytrium polystomum]|nr:hypothetical protein DFJ73DRAFT_656967 [Zopfochytrium polystomum]
MAIQQAHPPSLSSSSSSPSSSSAYSVQHVSPTSPSRPPPPAAATAGALSSPAPATPLPSNLNVKTGLRALSHATRASLRALLLGYSVRSGLSLLLKLVGILTNKKKRNVAAVVEAVRACFTGAPSVRFGLFFGGFAFLWKLTNNLLVLHRRKQDRWNGFISGFVAGAAILVEKPSQRLVLGQQILVRGLQAVFNNLKFRGHFHFAHADSLIFALCTAQVMYSYAMQPSTIPASFYKFIQTTGPISEGSLQLARRATHAQQPLDPDAVFEAVVSHPRGRATMRSLVYAQHFDPATTSAKSMIPCELLHPHVDSCNAQGLSVLWGVFRLIFPVYASLNVVPALAFRLGQLANRPWPMLRRIVFNTTRSSLFLGAYVGAYMRLACVIRDLVNAGWLARDHKYNYWLIGFISSASIFIEDKKRRTELAMYVLPRGVSSVHNLLYNRRLTINVPHFDVLMFSTGMGLIIAFLQTNPDMLGGLVRGMMKEIDRWIEDGEDRVRGGGGGGGGGKSRVAVARGVGAEAGPAGASKVRRA